MQPTEPMVTIAVDAMGGDKAPGPEVEGAMHAAREYGHRVLLVGDGRRSNELESHKHRAARVFPSKWSTPPSGSPWTIMRRKRRAPRRKAPCTSARAWSPPGKADGFVSAGNTGACMAIAKMVFGKVPGVDRPALSGVFPTHKGTPVVVLDVGANVDCEPRDAAAVRPDGRDLFAAGLKVKRPRVGLLSIGEEEHKGNALTRDATPLLKSLGINFIGNVEGRDIFSGHADVIVCDGFVGNVALKVSEGLVGDDPRACCGNP